jgi:hypothetical protein
MVWSKIRRRYGVDSRYDLRKSAYVYRRWGALRPTCLSLRHPVPNVSGSSREDTGVWNFQSGASASPFIRHLRSIGTWVYSSQSFKGRWDALPIPTDRLRPSGTGPANHSFRVTLSTYMRKPHQRTKYEALICGFRGFSVDGRRKTMPVEKLCRSATMTSPLLPLFQYSRGFRQKCLHPKGRYRNFL